MIPFPGESMNVSFASGVSAGDIRYREGSAVLSGEWVVWFSGIPALFEDPSGVVTYWAIEVLAGSGTIALEDANTPTLGVPSNPTTPIGSYPVVGPMTLVVPTLSFGASDLYLGPPDVRTGYPMLRLTSSDGITIQQVKLRVWPAAGVLGGYSGAYQAPAVEKEARVSRRGPGSFGASVVAADGLDFAPAQAAFRAELAATVTSGSLGDVPTGDEVVLGGVAFGSDGEEGGFGDRAAGALGAAYVRRDPEDFPPAPPGTFGVDWIDPPDEVSGEPLPVVGDAVYSWVQGTITLRAVPAQLSETDPTIGYPADGSFHVGVVELAAADPAGTSVMSLVAGAAASLAQPGPVIDAAPLSVAVTTNVTLPEFDEGDVLRVAVWHDGHLAFIDAIYFYALTAYSAGYSAAELLNGLLVGAELSPLTYLYYPPPFLYWLPEAVPEVPPLRQRNRGRVRSRLRADRQRTIRSRGFL